MAKTEAGKHGDPRHHTEDIEKLKVRIRQLEEEIKDLNQALENAAMRAYLAGRQK